MSHYKLRGILVLLLLITFKNTGRKTMESQLTQILFIFYFFFFFIRNQEKQNL